MRRNMSTGNKLTKGGTEKCIKKNLKIFLVYITYMYYVTY